MKKITLFILLAFLGFSYSLNAQTDGKIKITDNGNLNYSISRQFILDTTIFFSINSESYELKVLKHVVDENNQTIDQKVGCGINTSVCILKNGEIVYFLEGNYTSGFASLIYSKNDKLFINLGANYCGPGVQFTTYAVSQQENRIILDKILEYDDRSIVLFSKDLSEIIIATFIWGTDEGRFDYHKYKIELYNNKP